MKVNEEFVSIQGEISIGRLSYFIRLAGCNLQCGFCFGIRAGRRIPKIVLSNKSNKKIIDVKVGDKLLTLDKNHKLVETKVKKLIKRDVNEWFQITINNKIYFVTPEHPFFTTKGIKNASELKIGDEIYNITSTEKMSFMGKKYNCMYSREVVKKSINNTDYKKQGLAISKTIRKKQKDGIYVSSWYKLTSEDKNKLRQLLSERMLGENNPNYIKNYKYRNFVTLKKLCNSGKINICKDCGKEKKLLVHHIDENYENDSLENLTTICYSCHNKIHKRGYNFWKNNNRNDNKILSEDKLSIMNDVLAIQHNGAKVQKIKYFNRNDTKYFNSTRPKPLTVYNLSCEPYNTYLIDNMWVHNCDTKHARDAGVETSIDEIVEKAHNFPTVVITGGEPMLQREDVAKLITKLKKKNPSIRVEIETNGTIQPTGIKSVENVFFNVSVKLKNSGNEFKDRINKRVINWFNEVGANFKFVVENQDDIDEVTLLVQDMGIQKGQVFLMPEGCSRDEQWEKTERVISLAKINGYNFTPRFHILMWDLERGK